MAFGELVFEHSRHWCFEVVAERQRSKFLSPAATKALWLDALLESLARKCALLRFAAIGNPVQLCACSVVLPLGSKHFVD